ncbi:NAD-dependent deacylase [Fontisphaera persica]|uniref:SIR2 family NAD-dependent protein deacylase n=1 Tax=Fontisphaera persica TaxID=2974023 RepID=UPI0024C01B09|nr:NAD-dependent deacylase [Fontisphaera persica]WCJ58782.1 NAD-dependent deacylase [Fontisphaera persica]
MSTNGVVFPPELVQAMRQAGHIVASTGAGVSAESGVPTFRDAQTGFWAQFKPEELATPEAFAANPERVWQWYAVRRRRVREVQPNPGHLALAEMERRARRFTLITQNVDRLHQRAGSRNVVELHGCILSVRCPRGHHVIEDYQDAADEAVPRCPLCQAYLRPAVVWFGEELPAHALEAADTAARQCEVFLSIGTSTLVYPAAQLPFTALECGATVVEINPQPTPLTDSATYTFHGPSGVILPQLLKAVWGEMAAPQNP